MGNLPRSKWPLKFFRPGMGKAMQTIINHQNMHVSHVSGHKVIMRKGKTVSKAALSLWVHQRHKFYLKDALDMFRGKMKTAATGARKGKIRQIVVPQKLKRNAKQKRKATRFAKLQQQALAKKYYKMVLPLENRVKELKRKVQHQKRSRRISRSQKNLIRGFRRRGANRSSPFVFQFFPGRRRRSKFVMRKKFSSRFHRRHVFPQNDAPLMRRRRTQKMRGSVWTNAGNPTRGRRGLRDADYPFRSGGRMTAKDIKVTIARRRRSTYREEEDVRKEEEDDERDAEKNVWHHEKDSDEADDHWHEEDAHDD